MVDSYTTETEQVEQIKRWLREYGVAALVGVILALVIGYGWRFWQQRHENSLTHASMRYEQMLTNVVNGNTGAAEIQAARLMERYGRTPYASLAALQLARQNVYQNNLSAAEEKLRWVMENGNDGSLREVARLRLARVLTAENKAEEGLEILQHSDDRAYIAASWEVQGDILVKLGRLVQAHQAYQNAVKAFPGLEVMQPLLQMKLDNLAGVTQDQGAQ